MRNFRIKYFYLKNLFSKKDFSFLSDKSITQENLNLNFDIHHFLHKSLFYLLLGDFQ